jgi:hypothetical protein
MDETSLMHAAARGHIEIVKLLLVHGADPALRNRFGQTARDLARANGRSDVAALLSRAAPPTGTARAELPRFAPRIALMVAALAGALGMTVFLWLLDPGPAVGSSKDLFADVQRAPHWWQALLMVAVPVAVAVVVGRILSPVRLLIGKD